MKPWYVLLIAIAILLSLFIWRFMSIPKSIGSDYPRSYYSYIKADSGVINKHKVYKTIVYQKFFAIDKELNRQASQTLLEVLQDSANYVWESRDNLVLDKYLTFYDEKGHVLGSTRFSSTGHTFTSPSTTATSKFGVLNKDGLRKVLLLLEQ